MKGKTRGDNMLDSPGGLLPFISMIAFIHASVLLWVIAMDIWVIRRGIQSIKKWKLVRKNKNGMDA